MYNLKAPYTVDAVLVSQRVCHYIKCGAQFLFVCSQCFSHNRIPLSHYFTQSHLSEQAYGDNSISSSKISQSHSTFTVRISCYFPDICIQLFTFFLRQRWRQGISLRAHRLPATMHVSRSSRAVKLFFSSVISPYKPPIPIHNSRFVLPLLIFSLFAKVLLRSLYVLCQATYKIPLHPWFAPTQKEYLSSGK